MKHLCVKENDYGTKSTLRDSSYQNPWTILKEIAIMNSARHFEYPLPYGGETRATLERPKVSRRGYTVETFKELSQLLEEMK